MSKRGKEKKIERLKLFFFNQPFFLWLGQAQSWYPITWATFKHANSLQKKRLRRAEHLTQEGDAWTDDSGQKDESNPRMEAVWKASVGDWKTWEAYVRGWCNEMPSSCISSCVGTIDSGNRSTDIGKPEAPVLSFVTLPCSAETECLTEPGNSFFFLGYGQLSPRGSPVSSSPKAGIVGLCTDFNMVLGSEFPPSWMCSQHSYPEDISSDLDTCFFFTFFFIIIVIIKL